MSNMDEIDRFIGIADVLALTAIKSKSTVYGLIKQGGFPKAYPVTVGRRAWSHREVQNWISRRKERLS